MVEQDQNYNLRRNNILNTNGQAAIEYILLLVIIVSLIMGAKTAFSNVDKFINHYIGDYVVCLMEYGELPSLGVSDSTQKTHMNGAGKSCDEQFAGFTFEDGRPPTGGGSGFSGGGKTNSPSGGNKNSSSNASKAGSNGKPSSDSNTSADFRGRRNGGSNNSSSPYTRGTINRSNSYRTADASDSDGKVRVIEDDEESKTKKAGSKFSSRTFRSGYGGDKYRAITGDMLAQMEKTAPKKLRSPAVSIMRVSDEGNRFGPYKKTFIPPSSKKAAEIQDDNSGLSFGYIIRWLIIAGMILAIIVFFGSQIMNYSNSKE